MVASEFQIKKSLVQLDRGPSTPEQILQDFWNSRWRIQACIDEHFQSAPAGGDERAEIQIIDIIRWYVRAAREELSASGDAAGN